MSITALLALAVVLALEGFLAPVLHRFAAEPVVGHDPAAGVFKLKLTARDDGAKASNIPSQFWKRSANALLKAAGSCAVCMSRSGCSIGAGALPFFVFWPRGPTGRSLA
jgi:hypothetical protein